MMEMSDCHDENVGLRLWRCQIAMMEMSIAMMEMSDCNDGDGLP